MPHTPSPCLLLHRQDPSAHTPLSIPAETLKVESSSAGLESRTRDPFLWSSSAGNSFLHQEKYLCTMWMLKTKPHLLRGRTALSLTLGHSCGLLAHSCSWLTPMHPSSRAECSSTQAKAAHRMLVGSLSVVPSRAGLQLPSVLLLNCCSQL